MPPATDPTLLNWLINAAAGVAGEIGVFAIAATLITVLARSYIQHFFAEKRQEHQIEVDKELQQYQSELEKSLQDYQHEIEKERLVFSNLHERRADAIDGLYQRMNKFDTDMRSLVDPLQWKGEPSMDEKWI